MHPGYFKLNVTKPCTEDWATMTPTGAGRHCLLCNKDVIDFSVLNDEQVKTFFINNGDKPVCGRFRKIQLERIRITLPGYFFQKKIPLWQKYLVLFLICFGSSLFSIDINFSSSQGLFAQTPAAIIANHTSAKLQKKHKKKKRYKHIGVQITIPLDIIAGFTVIKQDCPEPVPVRVLSQKENKTNDSVVKESIAYTNTPVKEDRKPRNKTTFPKMEFLLPAALSLRLRRRGRKK